MRFGETDSRDRIRLLGSVSAVLRSMRKRGGWASLELHQLSEKVAARATGGASATLSPTFLGLLLSFLVLGT
jgi:hypothetical protein